MQPLDLAIARVLALAVAHSGKSYRDLEAQTGMSINRIGIILRGDGPAATVGEIDLIARAVGATAGEVFQAAEASAHLFAVEYLAE